MAGDFEPEQKRYLEGFVAGLQIARTAGNIASRNGAGAAGAATVAAPEPTGPDAPHWRAQDRVTKAGSKLSDQEK
jgi:ferredoxin-nitrite reductase